MLSQIPNPSTRKPKIALVLGGADCLQSDLDAYQGAGGTFDGVVACNDAGTVWPGRLDAWISLHPEKLERWKRARPADYPAPGRFMAHRKLKPNAVPFEIEQTEIMFPGQKASGSSGLMAAKVALIDLGFDMAVLCGIPMQTTPHFWDAKAVPWKSATGFRRQWLTVPLSYRQRMRSMSGWSRALLGGPEWIK